MTKVAILGCGPAGLLAALAAERCQCQVTVFSHRVKSPIGGAQYLHENPGLDMLPAGWIVTERWGTIEGYAQKVYGKPEVAKSWGKMDKRLAPAWSLREAYDILWRRFYANTKEVVLEPSKVRAICQNYDMVFCTLPAKTICRNHQNHEFRYQKIYIMSHYPAGNFEGIGEHFVIYNGRPEDEWVRFSRLWGEDWTEYPQIPRNPGGQRTILTGVKPLGHSCTCWDDTGNLHRLGRFGMWQRGILTHHAYQAAMKILEAA